MQRSLHQRPSVAHLLVGSAESDGGDEQRIGREQEHAVDELEGPTTVSGMPRRAEDRAGTINSAAVATPPDHTDMCDVQGDQGEAPARDVPVPDDRADSSAPQVMAITPPPTSSRRPKGP